MITLPSVPPKYPLPHLFSPGLRTPPCVHTCTHTHTHGHTVTPSRTLTTRCILAPFHSQLSTVAALTQLTQLAVRDGCGSLHIDGHFSSLSALSLLQHLEWATPRRIHPDVTWGLPVCCPAWGGSLKDLCLLPHTPPAALGHLSLLTRLELQALHVGGLDLLDVPFNARHLLLDLQPDAPLLLPALRSLLVHRGRAAPRAVSLLQAPKLQRFELVPPAANAFELRLPPDIEFDLESEAARVHAATTGHSVLRLCGRLALAPEQPSQGRITSPTCSKLLGSLGSWAAEFAARFGRGPYLQLRECSCTGGTLARAPRELVSLSLQ